MKPRICGMCLLLSLLFAWCAIGPYRAHALLPRPATTTATERR